MESTDVCFVEAPGRLYVSNEVFSGLLTEFYDETESRNLHNFALRIEGVPFTFRPLRGAFMLRCFQDMLDQMVLEEKLGKFLALVDLLQFILIKYLRLELTVLPVLQQLEVTFKDLIEVAKNFRPVVRSYKVVFLVNKVRDSLGDAHTEFLKLLSNDLKMILDCFAKRLFHGWEIQESCLLMTNLLTQGKDNPELLFFGFPYRFDRAYFKKRCWNLRSKKTKVRGKSIRMDIDFKITDEGHLRLQMAVEILVATFNTTKSDIIPIIRSVWKSVPWPLISAAEMGELLKPVYRGWNLHLKDLCQEYSDHNPIFAVPRTPQPRSLRDLAGVQVRTNLCQAKTLSQNAIDSLKIPKCLQEYIMLNSSHLPE